MIMAEDDEVVEETKPKKKDRLIRMQPVKVVRRQNQAVLVEWVGNGRLQRRVIPADKIDDGQAADDVLAQGAAYGLPWSELVTLSASPADVEAELHRIGIWTGDDLRSNTAGAVAALQRCYGVDLAALLQAATRYEKGRK
jgi:hypothetical protein